MHYVFYIQNYNDRSDYLVKSFLDIHELLEFTTKLKSNEFISKVYVTLAGFHYSGVPEPDKELEELTELSSKENIVFYKVNNSHATWKKFHTTFELINFCVTLNQLHQSLSPENDYNYIRFAVIFSEKYFIPLDQLENLFETNEILFNTIAEYDRKLKYIDLYLKEKDVPEDIQKEMNSLLKATKKNVEQRFIDIEKVNCNLSKLLKQKKLEDDISIKDIS